MKKPPKSNQVLVVLLVIVFLCSCFVTITYANAEENTSGSLVVVSLGDSYSSGEGIEPFYGQNKSLADKVKDEDWLAHRSTKGWPALLQFSEIAGFSGDYNVKYNSSSELNWYFAAASGATTEHISKKTQTKTYNKKIGTITATPLNLFDSVELPRQIDVFNGIEGRVDYVTMTIGGNDVKFADIITTCALFSSYLHFGKTPKLQEDIDKIWGDFDKTREDIEQVYRDVYEKAGPNAWIIVAGYPKLLDKEGRGGPINKAEAKLVNDNVVKFNNEIKSIVEKCSRNGMNIVFVDIIEEFDKDGGHQAYSEEPWINKITFFPKSEDLDDAKIGSAYSVHPNKLGAQAYARCVNAKIREIEEYKKAGKLNGIYPTDGTYYGSLDWSLNNYFRDGRDHVCMDINVQIENPEQILTNSASGLYVESKYILDEDEPVPASWSIDNVSVVEEDGRYVVYGINHYTSEVETFIWDENRFYSTMNVDLPFAIDAIVIDEAFCIDYLYDYSLSPNTLRWDKLGEYYLTYECYSGGWITVTIENGNVSMLKFEYSP